MEELIWRADPPGGQPIMAVALRGLFDVAGAATGAIDHLDDRGKPVDIASIDPEVFFNFTEERPVVRLDDDGNRSLSWPANNARSLTTADKHELVTLSGIEPHLRWRTFADAIAEIAVRCDAQLVVTLGAMVGMAPHTRPLGVVGSATNPELARRLGLSRPSYEGPTGLVGVLHDSLNRAKLPVISLRVSVPHYVPSAPNPEATRSLLARFELVTGIETGHRSLDDAAADWRQRVDNAVREDDEMSTYVTQLEQQVDASADDLLPSGDDLAAELQAFLRDHQTDTD